MGKPFSWVLMPDDSLPFLLARSIYCYVRDPQARRRAQIRHIACTNGRYSRFLSKRLYSKHSLLVSSKANIGACFQAVHPIGLIIGEGCNIGSNVRIYQNSTIGQSRGGFPTIGDNVIIYSNCVIAGDISIGDNSIVAAGSIVLNSVQANQIVAGNPARPIRLRTESDFGMQ